MSPELLADPTGEFQYRTRRYQSETALAGMWVFLASEMLFFGGLLLAWCFYRHQHPAGFKAATEDTQFAIGTINTVVLTASSFTFACGVLFARQGRNARVMQASLLAAGLGTLFMGLKILEWYLDIADHEVPGPHFKTGGVDDGGAQLFWIFYYIATSLHAIHLSIGIAMVCWIAWRAHKAEFSPTYNTPVEVVGLYWSFVDMVWMVLYPLIYLAGRGG